MKLIFRCFLSIVLISIIMTQSGCNTSQKGIFGKRTAHESYGNKLKEAGLSNSKMVVQWFEAANKSLINPIVVTLPYKETGYFPAEKPSAAGYRFTAKRGELLKVEIITTPSSRPLLFSEIYEYTAEKPVLKLANDTGVKVFQVEIKKDGEYLIRLQPELLNSTGYTIILSTLPSLAFPVRKEDNPKISSFWGVDRDGGARRHEGIDIFAKKRTPLVAASDGTITRVNENKLGGKVIFMRPDGKDYNLYYAHLDEQAVKAGQLVKEGEVIGYMGNSGNAVTTAPHLHFGIYTGEGAVDPLPFVNNSRPSIKPVKSDVGNLNINMRTKASAGIFKNINSKKPAGSIPSGAILRITGSADDYYKIILPDGEEGFVKSTMITGENLKNYTLTQPAALYDLPLSSAAVITTINSGKTVSVKGIFNGFSYVKFEQKEGWILN